VRHVLGVYEMLSTLRREFPHVLVESCAGGGGRADLGMLRFADQVWTSDNTDAVDRLQIQYGYTRAHSPRVMVNWVTDVPNKQTGRVEPLAFRFHVAMQGVLGIGGHIGEWSAEELVEARRMIVEYKQLRMLVQFGRQYWLARPRAIGPAAVQYVSPGGEQTVVFVYQVRGVLGAGVRRVRLHGLVPEWRYRRAIDGAESTGTQLMSGGIPADVVDPRHAGPTLDLRSGYQVWTAQ
jgi:alpha-galactosidase